MATQRAVIGSCSRATRTARTAEMTGPMLGTKSRVNANVADSFHALRATFGRDPQPPDCAPRALPHRSVRWPDNPYSRG